MGVKVSARDPFFPELTETGNHIYSKSRALELFLRQHTSVFQATYSPCKEAVKGLCFLEWKKNSALSPTHIRQTSLLIGRRHTQPCPLKELTARKIQHCSWSPSPALVLARDFLTCLD